VKAYGVQPTCRARNSTEGLLQRHTSCSALRPRWPAAAGSTRTCSAHHQGTTTACQEAHFMVVAQKWISAVLAGSTAFLHFALSAMTANARCNITIRTAVQVCNQPKAKGRSTQPQLPGHLHQEVLQEVVEAAYVTQPATQHNIRALAARCITLQAAPAAAGAAHLLTPGITH
jgi:hypothetical protein